MTAEELLAYLTHQGIELWIDGDNLRYRGPKITLPPGLVALLRQHKAKLRELLLSNRQSDKDLFPLSYTQKSMWFLHQLNPSSTAYNVHFAAKLTGAISAPALQTALDKLGARHQSLRIRYLVRDGLPWQSVEAAPSIPLVRIDASGWTETALLERVRADAFRPYDLLGERAARVHLYQRSPTEQILLIGMHHIRVDGWSIAILMRELGALYRSELSGQPAQLPPIAASFADFVAWQQWLVQSADGNTQLSYWTQELGGELPPLELPTDRPRPPLRSERGDAVPWSLDAESSRRLKSLAAAEGSTAFSVLLSAFTAFLHRYTGQEELLIGIPYHGRSSAKWNDVVGCLINTLVLHIHPRGTQSFAGLLREVHKKANEALTHADHPFSLLVEKLRPERDLSRTPLFQVLFAYENFHGIDAVSSLVSQREGAPAGELFGMPLLPIPLAHQEGQFDLTLRIMEDSASFSGSFCFSTDLFERDTAERMLSHFDLLLRSALASPGEPISHLDLLSDEERHLLLTEWNRTEADYPRDRSLADLFEAQAQRTPEATALVCGPYRLSYRDLDLRANQLAHLLRSHGIGAEGLVGLCMERSFEMVVALLGILKAGAAYVPLDPSLPRERLSSILSDSGVSLLLTRTALLARLQAQAVPLLCPFEAAESDAAAALRAQPTSRLPSYVSPESLAYVIYTSGSTGRPKGVMIPHRALVNYLWWCQTGYPVAAGQGAPVHSTLSFDLTVTSLWSPLLVGRPVHLLPEGTEVDALKNALLQNQDYSLVKLTPAHLELLNHQILPRDAAARTRAFVIGGENLLASQVSFWRENAPDTLLFNEYGPTETTVGCCVYLIKREDPNDGSVPIGRPIANTRLYVLDERSALVPVGIPGELYIGGAGVGRGYLNQPELTAQRFVPDPFSSEPGARMYRTGDLCRYRRDGNLGFLGRFDQQVKLRGYRIELGEIESVLASHPSIASCCVLLREDAPGDKRLVAYFVPSGDPTPDPLSLSSHLAACLPHYMLPSAFVRLDTLPLTANGKLDRRTLPPPPRVQGNEQEEPGPSSPIEQLLAEVFRELLRREKIPPSASFFELGGHSLLAMQLVSRLRKLCEVELPVQAVFESPSLGALAERVRASLAGGLVPLPPVRALAPRSQVRMSFAQQRLWLLQALDPGSCTYNIPMQWHLTGALDPAALQRSLDALAARHEVLRAVVYTDTAEPQLRIMPHGQWTLQLAQVDTAAAADRVLHEQAQRPFSLATEPPVRATLVRLSDSDHWLQLNVHHMAFDGWSRPILLRELSSLYEAERTGRTETLPALELRYADYAEAQRDWLAGGQRASQLAYWKQQLTPLPEPLELPTDRPRPGRLSGAGAWSRLALDEKTTAALKALCRREGITPFMALLAVYAITLFRYTGQHDFAIGAPIAGRPHLELEPLIGCFINSLVLRADLSGSPSYLDVLKRIKEKALGAYAHAEIPFEVLVEELNPPRDTGRSPLFQVMFFLQSAQEEGELRLTGVRVEEHQGGSATAKFDLTLGMQESAGCLSGILEYSTDLFDADTIDRFGRHFCNLVRSAVADPGREISRLEILSAEERRRTLLDWNETRAEYPRARCLHQLFEAQAQRTPDSVAVVFQDESLTYRQLDQRAERLALRLHELGVSPDSLVALCMLPSLDMLVALLAILKAGGAYAPLDPNHPKDRLSFVLEDASPVAILIDSSTRDRLPPTRFPILQLPAGLSEPTSSPPGPSGPHPLSRVSPDHLAYVLYTSGSTGQPKGVSVPHRCVVNLLWSMRSQLEFRSSEILLAASSLSFDVAGLELWLPLLTGARVVLAPAGTARDGESLDKLLSDSGASFFQATPSGFRTILASGWQGNPGLRVLVAGEALPPDLADFLSSRTDAAWNLYGPTETTIYSTCKRLRSGERPVTIGRPIANTQIYILDSLMQPVPIGVHGEIYIGGEGLARGYLNRPERTARAFLPDPFGSGLGQGLREGSDPQGRLYKTGDRARFLPDGSIEFLGRFDFQVKLRGFRIELGEIESVLSSHPAIKSCVVLLREDAGDKRLCAYAVLTPGTAPDSSELRAHLASRLPSYMLPSVFVFLKTLPMNTSGKLDRKALPPPSAEPDAKGYVPPGTPREQLVATAFAQVLGLQRVGIHDSFFDLGGHSLLGVRLIAELSRLTGQSLSLSLLFEHPTVRDLAQALGEESTQRLHKTLVLLHPAESRTPLFCVHPVGGHVLCYVELASSFHPPQQVYGLQAAPVDQTPALPELGEVASRYVTAIRSVQPHGPYQLLGWSLGGVLAFEMAQQLKRGGEEVALLALLDAYAPDPDLQQDGAAYSESELQRWFLRNLTGERLSASDAEPLPEDLARLQRALAHEPSVASPLQDRYEAQLAALYAMFRRHVEMERCYHPGPYDGRVLLLRAAERPTARSRDCGWAALCTGELEIVDVPGDHYTLLSSSNQAALAKLIEERLIRLS